MSLVDLGLNTIHSQNLELHNNDFNIGRVITVNKESYMISDGINEYFGKLTGNMLYISDSPMEFPTVGDFVFFQNFENDSLAIIHKLLNRKNLLKRKSAGQKVDFQLIAANVDYAIIMQALDNDFNVNRLERYLAMANEFAVEPIIFFSKSDLIEPENMQNLLEKLGSRISSVNIYYFSNFNKDSIEKIKSVLESKKTYCLIGSSGVGKTTLINNLLGKEEFETKEVRESDSKGKHTTTTRHLIVLDNGAMLIDTPGMRELANISINEGIDKTFDEISVLEKECKFNDCSHTVEKGCAVLDALENGDLDEKRYDNFIKLRKESEHYERSYLEKRKRDKEFGKMVKSIMKHKKKK